MDKKQLRKTIRAKKAEMTEAQILEASASLAEQFYKTEQYQNANTVFCYLPYNQEVRTEQVVIRALADGKRVALPKIYDDVMEFIYIRSLDEVGPGFKGIPEPVADGPIARQPDALILMPGLAFDRQGHRVGYGGGYYDRYLAAEPDHPTVALCYGFQLLDELDTEAFDVPVDLVLWA